MLIDGRVETQKHNGADRPPLRHPHAQDQPCIGHCSGVPDGIGVTSSVNPIDLHERDQDQWVPWAVPQEDAISWREISVEQVVRVVDVPPLVTEQLPWQAAADPVLVCDEEHQPSSQRNHTDSILKQHVARNRSGFGIGSYRFPHAAGSESMASAACSRLRGCTPLVCAGTSLISFGIRSRELLLPKTLGFAVKRDHRLQLVGRHRTGLQEAHSFLKPGKKKIHGGATNATLVWFNRDIKRCRRGKSKIVVSIRDGPDKEPSALLESNRSEGDRTSVRVMAPPLDDMAVAHELDATDSLIRENSRFQRNVELRGIRFENMAGQLAIGGDQQDRTIRHERMSRLEPSPLCIVIELSFNMHIHAVVANGFRQNPGGAASRWGETDAGIQDLIIDVLGPVAIAARIVAVDLRVTRLAPSFAVVQGSTGHVVVCDAHRVREVKRDPGGHIPPKRFFDVDMSPHLSSGRARKGSGGRILVALVTLTMRDLPFVVSHRRWQRERLGKTE